MQTLRLDYINNIGQKYTEEMASIRQKFIELEEEIEVYENYPNFNSSGAARTLAMARTHLETACMYTIKTLCLCGEGE